MKAAVGMTARRGRVALACTTRVERRRTNGFGVITNLVVAGVSGVALVPKDSLWLIAGSQVRHLTAAGSGALNSPILGS